MVPDNGKLVKRPIQVASAVAARVGSNPPVHLHCGRSEATDDEGGLTKFWPQLPSPTVGFRGFLSFVLLW